jgi:hypothetical protein
MLSFFSIGIRVGLTFFFSAAAPLNFLRLQTSFLQPREPQVG